MRALALRVSLGLSLCLLLGGGGWTQTSATREASLAAWARIAEVLTHPRCLNCHQENTPRQGDARRIHIPPVVRGVDDLGAGTMRCHNCHSESGNNRLSGVPGAPEWQFAPQSMRWEGLSSGELCVMIKDPKRNRDKTPPELIAHIAGPLVQWGWDPGGRRAPIPMPYESFVRQMKNWVDGGTACPP
jgi:hypothetical protein